MKLVVLNLIFRKEHDWTALCEIWYDTIFLEKRPATSISVYKYIDQFR